MSAGLSPRQTRSLGCLADGPIANFFSGSAAADRPPPRAGCRCRGWRAYEPSTLPAGLPERTLPLRTVVLLLAAVMVGVAVGVLTYLAGQPVPAAGVAGMVSAGATFASAHRLVGAN